MHPSQRPLAREEIPFTAPEANVAAPPEGVEPPLEWDWKIGAYWQPATGYVYDESGWLINSATRAYHDLWTGWRYDSAQNLLVDDATGDVYTMEREPVKFIHGIRIYPGVETAPYEVPDHLRWNVEAGYAMLPDRQFVYDPNSGWMIDPDTGNYHDAYYGYLYDASTQTLLDENTGNRYSMSYEPLVQSGTSEE